MGTGSPVDFTAPDSERWWREQAKRVLALGVQGIKADDGEGFYYPPEVRFADGRTGAQAGWAQGLLYRRSMQRALDEVHPGQGVVFGRPGWTGQQAVGVTWGGDQASDFWSLQALVGATLTAAASGFSNWSHDIGGYLGERLTARASKELLLRWVQFGCFTPLMQAHGRFEQEAWTYDAQTLDLYREYVLLHERLVPYVRAAAAHGGADRAADHPPAAAQRPARRPRLGDRRRLRLRPVAVGRAGARGGRARARGRPAARRLDRLLDRRGAGRRRRSGGERPARPHPRMGAARRADRHLSGRREVASGLGDERGKRRSRRRCGASRRADARSRGWPTAPRCAGRVASGPPRARSPSRSASGDRAARPGGAGGHEVAGALRDDAHPERVGDQHRVGEQLARAGLVAALARRRAASRRRRAGYARPTAWPPSARASRAR